MKFSQQQERAIRDQEEKFSTLKLLLGQNNKKVGIFGPAGVGKTHMARNLIEYLSDEFQKKHKRKPDILCGAISHQACGVLENMVDGLDVDYEVKTLASALSLKKNIDPEGNVTFVYKEKKQYIGKKWRIIPPPISYCDIFISDECSQLNGNQISQIDSLISPNATQIYLGDICQLPPIERLPHELHSPIFNIPNVTLSIPFRYEGDLQVLSEANREQILRGLRGEEFDMNFWKEFIPHMGKDYEFINDKNKFLNTLVDYNRDNENPYRVKFISYKTQINERTSSFIRNQINPNRFDWESGDLIRATNTFTTPDGTRNILVNSEHAIIERKAKIKAKVAFVNNYNNLNYYGVFQDIPDEEILKQLSFIDANIEIKEMPYWAVRVLNKRDWIPIAPVDKKQFTLWGQTIIDGHYYPREEFDNNKWKAFYDLEGFFAQIAYGYGNNSHTAQGLTVDIVGTHISDIMGTTKATPLERLQSLYVAITRAKYKNFLYYE